MQLLICIKFLVQAKANENDQKITRGSATAEIVHDADVEAHGLNL